MRSGLCALGRSSGLLQFPERLLDPLGFGIVLALWFVRLAAAQGCQEDVGQLGIRRG